LSLRPGGVEPNFWVVMSKTIAVRRKEGRRGRGEEGRREGGEGGKEGKEGKEGWRERKEE
jgi:hypothetical protein